MAHGQDEKELEEAIRRRRPGEPGFPEPKPEEAPEQAVAQPPAVEPPSQAEQDPRVQEVLGQLEIVNRELEPSAVGQAARTAAGPVGLVAEHVLAPAAEVLGVGKRRSTVLLERKRILEARLERLRAGEDVESDEQLDVSKRRADLAKELRRVGEEEKTLAATREDPEGLKAASVLRKDLEEQDRALEETQRRLSERQAIRRGGATIPVDQLLKVQRESGATIAPDLDAVVNSPNEKRDRAASDLRDRLEREASVVADLLLDPAMLDRDLTEEEQLGLGREGLRRKLSLRALGEMELYLAAGGNPEDFLPSETILDQAMATGRVTPESFLRPEAVEGARTADQGLRLLRDATSQLRDSIAEELIPSLAAGVSGRDVPTVGSTTGDIRRAPEEIVREAIDAIPGAWRSAISEGGRIAPQVLQSGMQSAVLLNEVMAKMPMGLSFPQALPWISNALGDEIKDAHEKGKLSNEQAIEAMDSVERWEAAYPEWARQYRALDEHRKSLADETSMWSTSNVMIMILSLLFGSPIQGLAIAMRRAEGARGKIEDILGEQAGIRGDIAEAEAAKAEAPARAELAQVALRKARADAVTSEVAAVEALVERARGSSNVKEKLEQLDKVTSILSRIDEDARKAAGEKREERRLSLAEQAEIRQQTSSVVNSIDPLLRGIDFSGLSEEEKKLARRILGQISKLKAAEAAVQAGAQLPTGP